MTLENSGGTEGAAAGGNQSTSSEGTTLLSGAPASNAPSNEPAKAPESKAPAADDKTSSAADWRSNFVNGLDDDTSKVWNNITGRYQSPQDLAKAHVNLVREMDKRIPVPSENAKPEDWEKVWSKLGRPEKADAYKFDEPDYAPLTDSEKETRDNFRSVAHRIGLNQRQVKELQDWQYQQRKVVYDAEVAAPQVFAQRSVEQLKKDWNVDFDRNLNNAKVGAKEIGGEEWGRIANIRLADGGLLGDHPDMVKIWTRVGGQLQEDDRRPVYRADDQASLKEQIETIQQEAIKNGKLPSSPEYHRRLQPLYDKLYGTKPMNPMVPRG